MEPREHLERAAQLLNVVYDDADDPDPRIVDAATHLQVAGVVDVLTQDDDVPGLDDVADGPAESAEADGGMVSADAASGTFTHADRRARIDATQAEPAEDFDYSLFDGDEPDETNPWELSESSRQRKQVVNPDTSAHHILGMIVDHGAPMTNGELTELAKLPSGTVSSGLSTLYKHTYLDRRKTPADGYDWVKNAYYPTKWGIAQLARLDAAADEEGDD